MLEFFKVFEDAWLFIETRGSYIVSTIPPQIFLF